MPAASSGGGFEAQISGYNDALNDDNERELVAWHWRPVSRSVVTRPHLHLAGQIAPLQLGRGLEPLSLADMHLPSGVVHIKDGVWFIIHEFDVAPRRAERERILDRQS